MFKILYICSDRGDPYRDRRFIEEFNKHSDVELIVCNYKSLLWAQQSKHDPLKADAAITMYSDKQIGKIVKSYAIKSFNKIENSFIADNKWKTYLKLKEANIPQPETSLLPKFNFPYIYKPKFGSLGRGVQLIVSEETAPVIDSSYIFQEYIEESAGKSVRVIMVNKKPVAWYSLVNKNSFKSNFAKGGRGHKIDLTAEMEDLCIRTAKCLDLDYCGIDLLYSNRGWLVLEVNSKAGLQGIESFTGINVAKHFVDYIIEILKENKD